jgi:hypothetical protein
MGVGELLFGQVFIVDHGCAPRCGCSDGSKNEKDCGQEG